MCLASAEVLVCATDPEVDAFKPDPKGLLRVAKLLDMLVTECLVIGDRDDRDGEAVRRAGMPNIILSRYQFKKNSFRGFNKLLLQLEAAELSTLSTTEPKV